MFEPVKRLLRPIVLPHLHKPDFAAPHTLHGSYYGGWPVLEDSLDADSLVYSFGVGCDISFDEEIIAKFGCEVHGFDPTPISLNWLKRQELPENFHFHALGVAASDGKVKFFRPHKGDRISFSVAPNKRAPASKPILAPTLRMETICRKFGHRIPDLVKLDIEGFEFPVIDDMISSGVLPRQLLVEFHHGKYNITNSDTKTCVEKVLAAGYRLFFVSPTGREYGFFRAEH